MSLITWISGFLVGSFVESRRMEQNSFILDGIIVAVTAEEVLRQLGYTRPDSAVDSVHKKIQAAITKTGAYIKPTGIYRYITEAEPEKLDFFWGFKGIVLAIATIGPELETYAKQLVAESRGASGMIVDAIGTVAAEKTADHIEQEIRDKFSAEGLNISRRYAPGYCGWDIKAQKTIFEYFPDTPGISLSESCLMIPEKSLSFVCVLNESDDFSSIPIGNCKRCRQQNCSYRLEEYCTESQVQR